MIGIYAIRNKVSGKVYIGQSVNIESRLIGHKSCLRHNRHENDHLQKSWNKYGEDNFEFCVLQCCSKDDLDDLEIMYIQKYSSMDGDKGYNNDSGGHANKRMSEEARRKMSQAKQGMYAGEKNPMYGIHLQHTNEWKQNMSARNRGVNNPMYGVHLTLSDKRRRLASERFSGEGNPFYGKTHSEETKQKMRQNNKTKKKVVCVETLIAYESSYDAQRQTGIFCDSINKCCNGKQHTAGGYHWKFAAQ